MPHLAQGGIQLGLEIGGRAGLCPRRRPPPSGGRGKALFPGIQPVGADPQLFGDHFRGLAAGQPVINGFAFERFIEFTAGLNGCLCHGLVGSLSTQSSVRQFEATRFHQAQRQPRIAHAKGFGFVEKRTTKPIRACRDCRQMDLAGFSKGQPPRRRKYPLPFGLSLESTPLRLAASLRRICALRAAPRRTPRQIRQPVCRRREPRLKGKIAMNTTAPFPSFEPLVKPFKFAASPYEYKVTTLRECPTPDAMQHCETPDKAADYWRLHIATHPQD